MNKIVKTKRINWNQILKQLIYSQSYIYASSANSRLIRNEQRLITKSFDLKLLILYQILKQIYASTNLFRQNQNEYRAQRKTLIYLQYIEELQNIQLHKIHLSDKNHLIYLQYQIKCICWIMAYIPIHEKITYRNIYVSRLNKHTQYLLFELRKDILNQAVKYIHFIPIKWKFTKFQKYWLCKNIVLESTFVIVWFQLMSSLAKNNQMDRLQLNVKPTISINRYFKSHFLCYLFYFLTEQNRITKLNYRFFPNILIYLSHNHEQYTNIQNICSKMNHSIQADYPIYTYNLNIGFTFFGFFFKKHSRMLSQSISLGNIQSHQLELIHFLKSSGTYPIDKVILILNTKIVIWKKFYLKLFPTKKLIHYLNKYLFWRIWYFLKKRHKNSGMKWLINKYYRQHKYTQKWCFYHNNIYLLSY